MTRHRLKILISHILYYTGVLQLWQAIVMRRKAVVLMYHRVLTPDEQRRSGSHPAIVVSRDTFDRHMSLLKRRFAVLSLDEFAERLEKRLPLPDRSCVITFDDGWLDNYTNALPILRKHDLPAVVFLPAGYIGRRRLFWPEAMTHLTVRAVLAGRRDRDCRDRLAALLAPAGVDHLLDVPDDDPRPIVIEAVRRARRLPRPEIEKLAAALAAELGVDAADPSGTDAYIDWAQAGAMADAGVAFGGHGSEHLLLTEVSEQEVDCEIRLAKDMLDRRFPDVVPTFSYPNGYHTPAIAAKVKAAGYRLAFITSRGFVTCDDDPFTVKRLNVHDSGTGSLPMFLARVVGLM